MLRRTWRGIRSLFRVSRLEREMERELRFHLERETEENIRRGMTRDEARRAALLAFGGVERVREDCRDVRRLRLIETLWQDLRYGARVLKNNPGFTIVAVFTLALGIGANTAIFSVIYGALLRPLPYQEGDQLVVLRQQAPLAGVNNLAFSVAEIADYRERNKTLAEVVEHHSMNFILYGGAEPDRIQTGVVSANFFDVIGVRPLLGRTFRPDDEKHGAEAVLILSYEYWRRRHGGDPNIIGKVFRMNDRPHTVIGVLPPVPQYPNENDVYMPTSACPTRSSEQFIANRNSRLMSVFGRLKAGVGLVQAQTDLVTIAGHLQQAYPESYPPSRGYRVVLATLKEELTRQARPTFRLLLGTAGLVLLIACFSVANLMLARLMRREREMSLRAALGASRSRLIRQLLTESALLALMGGGVGLLIAAAGLNLLAGFAARFTTRASEISIDSTVLIFTLAVALLTGLVFGLLPALSARTELATALKDGGASSTSGTTRYRLRSVLVIAQVAVSFTLLIGAGLMFRSFIKLQHVDPGFNPEKVLVMRLSSNWSRFTTGQHYRDFYRQVVEKIRTQPGILAAAMSNSYPLNALGSANGPFKRDFFIEGRAPAENEQPPQADFRYVSPDFFATIRMPVVTGRLLTEGDNERAPAVAVINQSLARHRWGNEDPLGKRITLDRKDSWVTIVGIVGDVRQYGLEQDHVDAVYEPVAQAGFANYLLARTAADPRSVVNQIRSAIHQVDPETAIDEATTLEQARSESLASPRLTTILLGLFAVIALLITAAGIAGVMALSVSQRTHELGIRMALGAAPMKALFMVPRQGMMLALIGLGIGLVGALALAKVLASFLFAVEPTDPLTYLGVSLVLALTSAIACFVPARRVTRIDPMIALRSE